MIDAAAVAKPIDVETLRQAIHTWRAEVFNGAPQASSAAKFGTIGINFRARKLSASS